MTVLLNSINEIASITKSGVSKKIITRYFIHIELHEKMDKFIDGITK